jgi:L-serine dehydratase
MPSIFDIIGPVTVGPSSSHTAGAIRIGQVARLLLGIDVHRAVITFYGSFADTWKGHGTDKAVVGGLLGLPMDSPLIRTSLTEAAARELEYEIRMGEGGRFHPNTVAIEAEGEAGRVAIRASSVGGGNISLDAMDGYELGVSCAMPTLIVPHNDHPGVVAAVTAALSAGGYNIAAMKVSRARRGGSAVAVIETDEDVSTGTQTEIARMPGIDRVIHIPKV